jgi:putative PIN family toxin of toxin-antitoxin system
MRVVADSNIVISAFQFGGKPERFLQAAELERYHLIASGPILVEIAGVLSRKFQWSADRVAIGLGRIRAIAEVVFPTVVVSGCDDPDDDRILEAAVEGRADIIVSGDNDLLRMNAFRGIEICTLRGFLLRLDQPGSLQP